MDADHKKSQEQYIESQKILIENLELNILNDRNMIYIHDKSLSLNINALEHEKEQLKKYLELYPDLK